MTMLFVELALNIAVATLLLITIAYCWRLNQRIRALQDGKSELARLLKHFDESTRRASDSIASLQVATRKLSETIQGRIDKANLVADDLMFLVERAAKLGDEMEAGLAARRAADAALTSSLRAATASPARPEAHAAPKPAAKKPEVKAEAKPEPKMEKAAVTDAKALLAALAARGVPGAAPDAKPLPKLSTQRPAPKAPTRTQVEKELLELIKSGSA